MVKPDELDTVILKIYFTRVLGKLVTMVLTPSCHLPNFLSAFTLSNLLRTLRLVSPLEAFPKLGCLDMGSFLFLTYLILGIKAFSAASLGRALVCSL